MTVLRTREQLRHTLEHARWLYYEQGAVSAAPSPPQILSLSPGIGLAGTLVTIIGSGFTGATLVTFGGVSASFSVVNDSTITATAPAGSGTVDVRVTTPNGTSSLTPADLFIYGTVGGRVATYELWGF